MRKIIGFIIGGALFLIMIFLPDLPGMPVEAKKTAAVALLMATLWMTEAIPIAVTSLIPIAAFPLLGVLEGAEVTKNYGDQNIFLFLGGFLIALAMERWDLHRRIALNIIKIIGLAERRIVLGFMCASAFLSMFISNTATAVMMLPVALSVVHAMNGESSLRRESGDHYRNAQGRGVRNLNGDDEDNIAEKDRDLGERNGLGRFGTSLMLGVAYAASVGGIGTLIGSPPNIILAGSVHELFPDLPEITFARWLIFGIPLVIILLPLIWLYLTFFLFRPGKRAGTGVLAVDEEIRKLGTITRNELLVLAVFLMAVVLWITRADLPLGSVTIHGWGSLLGIGKYTHDSTVSIFAAVLLFLLPAGKGERILRWEDAKRVPWGVLLLFGGGFALAEAFQRSGLAVWIGQSMACMKGLPMILIVVAIVAIVVFLTELTSNTALTVTMMPVMAALSTGIGVHPFALMIPTAISASCAFMLPVATPPNAIVYSSGYITLPQMAKAGFLLNITSIILITALTYLYILPMFHIA